MLFKRIGAWLAMLFGFLGVIACMAGIYGVWLFASRIEQAHEKAFAALDKGLASAQTRVRGVQKRVKESRITTAEIKQKLRDWSKGKAKERLVSQLEIESRTEKLAAQLQTADSWLETSTEAIRGVQQILDLGSLLGMPVDAASLEQVLEKLTSLRDRLQETERTANAIHASTAVKGDGSEESRLSRATKLLGRALLMIADVDTRLDDTVARLSEIQNGAQELKARTSNHIMWTTIGCYLLLTWIAAGQAALCCCGWRNCCPS